MMKTHGSRTWATRVSLLLLALCMVLGAPSGAQAAKKAKHSSKAPKAEKKAACCHKKHKKASGNVYGIKMKMKKGGHKTYVLQFKDKKVAERQAKAMPKNDNTVKSAKAYTVK